MEKTQEQMQEFIEKMNEARVDDFISTLKNDEDFHAHRTNLVMTAGKSLEALHEIEQDYLTTYMANIKDKGLCPSCFADAVADVANIRNICEQFNNYLDGFSGPCDEG